MTSLRAVLKRQASRLAAAAIVVVLYLLAQLPQVSDAERRQLAAHFRFQAIEIPGDAQKNIRAVHPSLATIDAWISSVGAGVALADLDGDGLPNDLCLVDPRSDSVVVAPARPLDTRFRRFTLPTPEQGYKAGTIAPMGCLPGDLNEDGLTDVLVYYWGRTPVAFLRTARTGPADPAPERLGPSGFVPVEIVAQRDIWNSNAGTLADLDGDGHLDIVIGNYFADGHRVLDSVTAGRVDMQHSMSRAYNGGKNRVLLWQAASQGAASSVEFRETVALFEDTVARGWTLALGTADLNGDQLPEIYFANDFGPDRLLVNRSSPGDLAFELVEGRRGLSSPRSTVLGRDSFKGMGVDFADVNNDGRLDIYVSNIAEDYALQESHLVFVNTGDEQAFDQGYAPFVNQSETLGLSRSSWGWDAKFADFNNDGVLEALQATGFVRGTADRWPELHELAMGNDELVTAPGAWPRFGPGADISGDRPNAFFVRASDGRYYDLAGDLELDEPHVSRGIAIADIDRDCDLDFALANQWQASFLFVNDGPDHGACLGLDLRLAIDGQLRKTQVLSGNWTAELPAARPAVGASVTVRWNDGSVERRLVAQLDGGNGHSGVRAPDLHFGLGRVAPDTPITAEIRWRDTRGLHEQRLNLTPGWHAVLLGSDLAIAER